MNLVVKTNIDGSKMWDNEIYIGGHNLGNSIMEFNDGYIIFGGLNMKWNWQINLIAQL